MTGYEFCSFCSWQHEYWQDSTNLKSATSSQLRESLTINAMLKLTSSERIFICMFTGELINVRFPISKSISINVAFFDHGHLRGKMLDSSVWHNVR